MVVMPALRSKARLFRAKSTNDEISNILVLRPPLLCPIASLPGFPLLHQMDPNNGCINHCVLVVRVLCQGFKHSLPHASPDPARQGG